MDTEIMPRSSVARRTRRGLAWNGLLAVLLLCGCAAQKTELLPLAWPEPPLEPRIKFLQAIQSQESLGGGSLRDDVLEFLAGKQPPIGRLSQPVDVAVSDDGNRLYISDYSQRVVYLFDLEEKVVRYLGGEKLPVGLPFGVALDAQENLYVTDQAGAMVRVFDKGRQLVRSFGDKATLGRPTGIAIDRARGRIYVCDSGHQKGRRNFVKIFDTQGRFLGNLGEGKDDRHYSYLPTYVKVDRDGNLYVTDTGGARVLVFDPEGTFVRQIGDRGDGLGRFDKPKGVALDAFGNVYVVDTAWSNVQIFNPKGDLLLFFGGRSRYPGLMQNPTGIAIDAQNRIYVADTFNFRVNAYQLVNTTAEDAFLTPPDGGEKGGQQETEMLPNVNEKGGEMDTHDTASEKGM